MKEKSHDRKANPVNTKTFKVSDEIPIWKKSIPDADLISGEETIIDGIAINVSDPTIRIFSPIEENSGAAVVVFPGGGYTKVALELEGSENSLVCFIALQKANVHAEYHVYAEGGQAFGLNRTILDNPNWNKLPVADWESLVERWLKTIKMTPD